MILFPSSMGRGMSLKEMRSKRSTSKDDHGERTNTKLHDQPFHQRTRDGKMRKH